MEYIVRRTTYDKLEAHLNALAGDGWHIAPVYMGGRDWVMVCSRGDAVLADYAEALRAMEVGVRKGAASVKWLADDLDRKAAEQ